MIELPSFRAFQFSSDLSGIEDAFSASMAAKEQARLAAEVASDRYEDSGEDDDKYDDDGGLVASTRQDLRWQVLKASMSQTVVREAFVLRDLVGGCTRRDRVSGISVEPAGAGGLVLREAGVGDDQRRTGAHPAAHFGERTDALVAGEEVEGEEAGGRVERTGGGSVDRAFDQLGAGGVGAERRAGEVEHRRRRVDAGKAPAGLRGRERLEFEAAAGAEHENVRVGGACSARSTAAMRCTASKPGM
jgi:hypothetical protein